ncbi:Serine/threonine-protein kinase AFC2 [Symbiodinium microadriaticum]|uniref:Serine/threonine-protein kinase AFC2 n=1 Tax=Symbiodinium microadriaticum TaxID=2951 RepID=A0A1Q9DQ00_SYMMI|nr:Serine/threonine-protein kinase AFC2 [Symbiodinium microadriaticum]CAE7761056.1 AFC2 [Symbiodinium microadriaticum]
MQGLGYGSSRKSSRQSRSRSKKRQKTAGDLNQPLSVSSCTDTYTSDSDDSDYSYSEVSEPKKAGAGPRLEKDEVQHFEWRVGLQMNARYVVSKFLGDGTFGRVLQAKDCKRNRQVAIKIIRNVAKYTRNAMREAEILQDIRAADPKQSHGCVRLHETFFHEADGERLFCLVCEALGMSLYDLLKQNQYRGLWVQDIQSISRQCLEALRFLHADLNLTHTDLKLENVLLRSSEAPLPSKFPREEFWQSQSSSSSSRRSGSGYVRPQSTEITLIDFGNATYELEHHSSIINTRQYRAPEVILSLGWNEVSDLWSIGCIVSELYTGELLFRTHESLEHLALMQRALERFPQTLLAKAGVNHNDRFVVKDPPSTWRLRWPEGAPSEASSNKVRQQRPLHQMVQKQHRSLADFTAALLILDPSKRPSAKHALDHAFLAEKFTD